MRLTEGGSSLESSMYGAAVSEPDVTNPAAGAVALRTRRSHRKSRNGCLECKRRHIRCDEARSGCTNCQIAERTCSYPARSRPPEQQPEYSSHALPQFYIENCDPQAKKPKELIEHRALSNDLRLPVLEFAHGQAHGTSMNQATHTQSPSESSSSGDRSHITDVYLPQSTLEKQKLTLPSFTESFLDNRLPVDRTISQPTPFTATHMKLLHHIEHNMDSCLFAPGHTALIVNFAVKHISVAPYVMDVMLGLAACHMSDLHFKEAAFWHLQATELQTRGLASHSRETEHMTDDMDNCASRFLFSSLISKQFLHETFTYHRTTLPEFIDHFTRATVFTRGVAATSRRTYQYLITTELEPLFATGREARTHRLWGEECLPLRSLLESPTLQPHEVDLMRSAIHCLQDSYDLLRTIDLDCVPHPAGTFASQAPSGYVDMMRQLKPEALIIAAYHGVLFHRTRKFWIHRDTGEWLIREIARQLDGQWSKLMQWPLEVIEKEKS